MKDKINLTKKDNHITKMKFIKVRTMGQQGRPDGTYWANPDRINGVATIMIPGNMIGADNQPVMMHRSGIDIGGKLLPVDMKPEDVVKLLEEGCTEIPAPGDENTTEESSESIARSEKKVAEMTLAEATASGVKDKATGPKLVKP